MDTTELRRVLEALAQIRPVFHSEADFQHAFAWEVQRVAPGAAIRLETRPARGEHLDLLVTDGSRRIAVELKYLTAAWAGTVGGETFDLLPQGAQDIRGYDCVKDIARVERFTAAVPGSSGLVVVLANDATYWRPVTHGRPTNADAFRLREGTTITGSRAWGLATGAGTMRGRERALDLRGEYLCSWRDYARLDGRHGLFRYLAFDIPPTAG